MKKTLLFSILLLATIAVPSAVFAACPSSIRSNIRNGQCVEYTEGVRDGSSPLRGWLYRPDGSGQRPAIIWNHASNDNPGEQRALVELFNGQGYVFFVPHRTGHGLSAGAGLSTVEKEALCATDLIPKECRAAVHDQVNADVVEAVKFLRKQSFVDSDRIAMSGSSYGGIQVLLTAEKGLHLRGFIAFTPGAQSFSNEFLSQKLLKAVINAKPPIRIIQAENDHDIRPVTIFGTYLTIMKGGLNGGSLYPPFGSTPEEAHGAFVLSPEGIAIWDDEVLAFLVAAFY